MAFCESLPPLFFAVVCILLVALSAIIMSSKATIPFSTLVFAELILAISAVGFIISISLSFYECCIPPRSNAYPRTKNSETCSAIVNFFSLFISLLGVALSSIIISTQPQASLNATSVSNYSFAVGVLIISLISSLVTCIMIIFSCRRLRKTPSSSTPIHDPPISNNVDLTTTKPIQSIV